MGDSTDIYDLLRTGYFTVSRAKNAYLSATPQTPPVPVVGQPVPRSVFPERSQRPSYPPPASVEDEAVSLAKEHGTSTASCVSEEEPPSRGEIDQHPIIVEVHEHNPERRFVLLSDSPNVPDQGTKAPTTSAQCPATTGLRQDKNATPQVSPDRKKGEPVWDRKQPKADDMRPALERPPIKPDVFSLEIDSRPDRLPEHHRSRSTTSASRPDYLSSGHSRQYGDQLLSPDIIEGGHGRREKIYRGQGQTSSSSARLPYRQVHVETSDRQGDDRKRQTASTTRRSESSFEPGRSSRRASNNRANESRHRKDYLPSRTDKIDASRSYKRSEGERIKNISPPHSPREQSRSSDKQPKDPYPYSYMQKTPIVVQDGRPTSASAVKGSDAVGKATPRSRMSAVRRSSPSEASLTTSTTMTPRISATIPMTYSGCNQRVDSKVQLPYPDDDDLESIGLGIQGIDVESDRAAPIPSSTVSMPEPSPPIPLGSEPPFETRKHASTFVPTGSWPPPSFDPERDGLRTDRPIGLYRHFSESKDKDGSEGLPECPRTKPVAGMIDWLTLPRTDFNICPTCYETVFSKSKFRTHFQPMLRPTDEAIACDFGLSPWYRIAWLLTLKHEKPDLRLFYQLASVMTSSRRESCPGNQKATRYWLTVEDPFTRRPVPGFTVCYQCARIVEVLLPNLTGVFARQNSRPEPTRNICALHFTPGRRQFVLLFDAFETTSDKAFVANQAPNIAGLAQELQRLSIGNDCREDCPVYGGYWHVMQSLPELTVCRACFDQVVRPKLEEGNSIAQDFSVKPQRLPSATCQLYSPRMRDIFQKVCRRRDYDYLEARVLERRKIEAEIYEKLLKLDKAQRNDAWTERQVEKLVEEWRGWE